MVSSCLIWVEYELNLSHLNIVRSGSVRSGLQQFGPLHPSCAISRSTQTVFQCQFFQSLSRQKPTLLAPWICELFILIFRWWWDQQILLNRLVYTDLEIRYWFKDHVMMWLIETSWKSAPRHLVQFLFGLTSPRLCYFRSFRSTRTWTAHQYRKHPRHFEIKI